MEPLVLINGQPQSGVSSLDRGLLYGQGLFETIRLLDGQSPLMKLHLQRLCADAPKLFLTAPHAADIEQQIARLWAHAGAHWQKLSLRDCTLKILLTGGEGGRGYRQPVQPCNNLILHLFERHFIAPQQARARLCNSRLSASQFAGIKHCNRLEQIAAAAELQAGDFEGLLLDDQGALVEGISSNILLLQDGQLITPALDRCGVKGVLRQWLLDQLGTELHIGKISAGELMDAQAVYAVNSNWGVVKIHSLLAQDQRITYAANPWDQRLAGLHHSLFGNGLSGNGVAL